VTQLADYSGPFDPQWSYDTLSRETLLNVVKAYGEYLHRMDAHWYLTVKDRLGNDEAFACDCSVWENRLQTIELNLVTSLLNIHGEDVVSVMKYMQASPSASGTEQEVDFKNNNHAIFTVRHCPTLHALEKERAGREKLICQDLTTSLFTKIAHYFNPDIKVTGIKVPPRTTYRDCACQWEFKLGR